MILKYIPTLKNLAYTPKRLASNISKSLTKKHVCIVGGGPAGFYAAQYLAKNLTDAHIDIIERLPVPFGLVRYGVAPDHPEVKNVISTFTKTASNPSVRFFGNVELGRDISLKTLRENYHAVLLTYGAEQDRTLGIPGETLPNVLSAREFVGWYNGDPLSKDLRPNLQSPSVSVLGQGNVAMDVARILLTPVDVLKKTDITAHALEALAASKVQRVSLIGRRGPLQAAFTIKELREMLKLPDCRTIWRQSDFIGVADSIGSLPRPRKRITELMLKSLGEMNHEKQVKSKEFCPIFLRSPLEITEKDGFAYNIKLNVNKMIGDKAESTSETEIIDSDLILRSIGYKSVSADPDLSFDANKGLVPNEMGRVLKLNSSTDYELGLYVGGWLRTGPTGVIITTMNNAFEVAETICQDFRSNENLLSKTKGGFEELKLNNVIDWQAWERIDKVETEAGKLLGKPREKLLDVNDMLKAATT